MTILKAIKPKEFPLIFSIILVVVLYFFNFIVPIKELVYKLANIIVNINVGVLGFLLTILALLPNVKYSEAINVTDVAKKHVALVLIDTIAWNVFVILPSVIILVFDKDTLVKMITTNIPNYKIFFVIVGYMYAVCVFTSLVKTVRFAYLFTTLISFRANN